MPGSTTNGRDGGRRGRFRAPFALRKTNCWNDFATAIASSPLRRRFKGDDSTRRQEARAILDDLEDEPKRRERTRALRVQLELLENSAPREIDKLLEQMLDSPSEHASLSELAPLLRIASKLNRIDIIDRLASRLETGLSDDDTSTFKRVLADVFAQTRNEEAQRRALAIYRELAGTQESTGAIDPAMFHNMASVIYDLEDDGWPREALRAWKVAYSGIPADVDVRKGLSQCLLRLGRHQDAQRVLRGEPINFDA